MLRPALRKRNRAMIKRPRIAAWPFVVPSTINLDVPALDILGDQLVNRGKQWHGQHHPQDSGDPPTNDDGGENPDAGQANAFADN